MDEALTNQVFDGEHVHVLAEMCATCVFRPGNLMSLPPGRLAEMVTGSKENDAAITCHSTLYVDPDQQQAVCRGYWDRYWRAVFRLRLAEVMGIVVYIDPPAKE